MKLETLYLILSIMTEIIGYTIPALVVLAATWLVMHKFYKAEEQKRLWEMKRASQKEISPIRMRAYERLSLLLERTTPAHMLMDMPLQALTVLELQQRLLRTIRQEYDHNLSQQIYVSDEVWDKISHARDEMGAFVTTMGTNLPKEATSLDYAKALITAYNTNGETPNGIALSALKEEARKLL